MDPYWMLFLIINCQKKNPLDEGCCEHHTFYQASDILKQFRYSFSGMAGCATHHHLQCDRQKIYVE